MTDDDGVVKPLLNERPPEFGQRHRMLAILTLCNLCLYLNRANISVAITFMYVDCGAVGAGGAAPSKALSHKCAAITDAGQCRAAVADASDGSCAWNDMSTERSNVLAAFYWGYMCSQIPAGWWASVAGGKRVLSSAVLVWSVATAFATPAASWLPALTASRAVVGAAEGLNYPAQVVLNAQWVPAAERSRAWSLVSSGESAGTVLAMAVCPFLAHSLGWGSIFWLSAIVGCLWLVLFHRYVEATPEAALRVRKARDERLAGGVVDGGAETAATAALTAELRLIKADRGELIAPRAVPWGAFCRNGPFRTLMCAHFCYNYGYYVVLSWLPQYFKSMFGADYTALGVAGMLPYIALALASNAGGVLADRLVVCHGWRLTTVRRLFNTIGFLSPALCFFSLRWVQPCADTSCGGFKVAVLLLTAGVGLGGLAFSGYWANFIDLSPRFSGHLMGISNSVATIPGIAGNLITGRLLAGRENDWDLVFGLAAAIYVSGAAVFLLFARAERQPFDGFGVVDSADPEETETAVGRRSGLPLAE